MTGMLLEHGVVAARDRNRRKCTEILAVGIRAPFAANDLVETDNVRRDFLISRSGLIP
jgi:hypothetical protein